MCEWRSRLDEKYRCKVPAEEGSKFCIFHEPGEKDIERFKQAFYSQIGEEGPADERNAQYEFTGYVFPTGLAVHSGKAELILPREISGALIVAESTIEGDANFEGATFKGRADFRDATFKGRADFRGATFKGRADFMDATIEGDANFWGATFIKVYPDFRDATFKAYASFGHATFKGGASFWGATFKGNADFGEATIEGGAVFGGATFKRTVFFVDATIEGDGTFEGAEASFIYLGDGRPTILWWERNREGVTLKNWSTGSSFWAFARRTFAKMDERERADAAYYFEKL